MFVIELKSVRKGGEKYVDYVGYIYRIRVYLYFCSSRSVILMKMSTISQKEEK